MWELSDSDDTSIKEWYRRYWWDAWYSSGEWFRIQFFEVSRNKNDYEVSRKSTKKLEVKTSIGFCFPILYCFPLLFRCNIYFAGNKKGNEINFSISSHETKIRFFKKADLQVECSGCEQPYSYIFKSVDGLIFEPCCVESIRLFYFKHKKRWPQRCFKSRKIRESLTLKDRLKFWKWSKRANHKDLLQVNLAYQKLKCSKFSNRSMDFIL